MPIFGDPIDRSYISRRVERKGVMANAQRRRHDAEVRQANRDEKRNKTKRSLKKLRRGY